MIILSIKLKREPNQNQVQKLARTHRQVNSLARAVAPPVDFANLTIFLESLLRYLLSITI